MKFKKSFILMISVMMILSSSVVFAEQTEESITRGDFFNAIVEQLGWTEGDSDIELPSDVSPDSPYATSVRILLEKQVLTGFPDGTIKADDEIIPLHAGFLLARLLGVPDQSAASFLEEEYNISITDGYLSMAKAEAAVATVLTSDQDSLDLLYQSNEAQLTQSSYRINMTQSMSFEMREGVPGAEELAGMTSISTSGEITYHDVDGIHMLTKIELPEALPDGTNEMVTEQYIVPDGMYIKMSDPLSGEDVWMSMPLFIDFEDILEMQASSLQLQQSFNDEFFFYRQKDQVSIDDMIVNRLAFNGKVDSFGDIGEMAAALMPGMLDELQEELDTFGSIVYSGEIWIDVESNLPVKMIVNMIINNNDAEIPFGSMEINMEMDFYDYNQVEGITLPEEALNASDLSMFDFGDFDFDEFDEFDFDLDFDFDFDELDELEME